MYDFNDAPIQAVVDPASAFSAYMAENGFDYIEVEADGKMHRFDVEKRGDKAGWYILFIDGGCPAGVFGNWKTDAKYKWAAKDRKQMAQTERLEFKHQMAEVQKKRTEDKERRRQEAMAQANRIWALAAQSGTDYPYLQAKGVVSYGLKENMSGQLVVPACDNDGVIWTLQTINPDGSKRFLPGGAKKGNYFTIPGGDPACICEGYATGATIRQAIGWTVFVAFDSGNLKPVAENIKAKYPNRQIVIFADNDQ